VASAAWVGYLAAGGVGALSAAGAVAALELGKGFRVVTAPRVVKRLVLEKAGLGVERCSACGRSAPELLCRDPRVNEVLCSACATHDSRLEEDGWWLVTESPILQTQEELSH
jgi:hypothetical protein